MNVLAAIALWQAVQNPLAMRRLFTWEPRSVDLPRERIQYLVPPPDRNRQVTPPRPVAVAPVNPGGSSREGRAAGAESANPTAGVTQAPLVAPTEVPSTLPPAKGAADDVGAPASGPLASGRGPLKGVQPGYADPRLWVQAPIIEYAPKSDEERLDSAVVMSIMKYRDSLLANTSTPNRFERGDWTYRTKGGQRYGVDQQFIRLGKFSIPTALLALLPLNMQGNPVENDRQARLAAMRADIMMGAQAAMNEEEFRRAVKAIRARKEKERKEAEKKKGSEPKTISNP